MGDKNQLGRITSSTTQLKTGHGVLKAVYVATPGDRIFEVINGTSDSDTTLISVDLTDATNGFQFLAPYINHPFSSGLRIQVVSGSTGELIVIYE